MDYELWIAGKIISASRRELSKYRNALDEAYIARFNLEKKYSNLQGDHEHLLGELNEERETSSKDQQRITDKLDEEALRNDILEFQLEQVRIELAESKANMQGMAENIQGAVLLQRTVQQLESEIMGKDHEIILFTPRLVEKDCVIDQLQKTCELLKGNLHQSQMDKEVEITDLRTTISTQLGIMRNFQNEVAEQKGITYSVREAASAEIERLKAFYEENERKLEIARDDNQNLQNDIDALIDMSVQTEEMENGYLEEKQNLESQLAIQNRELELIKVMLMERFPDLKPDLSNLPQMLKDQTGPRRNDKRRCRR